MQSIKALPELLAPAGHIDSLSAAVAAGADAVYFGVGAYNARMNAKNFDGDELKSALSLCHAHGVKAHVTLNTQLYDRELDDALRTAEELYEAGVDALIVADLGLAKLIHKYFPDFELHASTQAAGHSVRDAEYFSSLGFSRIVVARETSCENIARICEASPIAVEMFVHGANCVSFSGQCLMSSLIGGRSGNRGECAQPCRLGYNGGYPLSPKDLCLAEYIDKIIDLGVSSLKIEGRMKSPDYVYRVVSVYRKLLDERRGAESREISELSNAFSRSGFTDGFFTGEGKKRPNSMLGVRTEGDKATSRKTEIEVPKPSPMKIVEISAEFCPEKEATLTLKTEHKTVSVSGAIPETAKNRPMTAEYAASQLSKFGGTPFTSEGAEVNISVSDGIMLPASALNELRRRGVAALTKVERNGTAAAVGKSADAVPEVRALHSAETFRTAEFLSPDSVTEEAERFFERIYLPLEVFDGRKANGIVMPPIIYDGEEEKIRKMLLQAVSNGAKYVITANSGQIKFVKDLCLEITSGYRYNVNNSVSAAESLRMEAKFVTLSPELTLPQARDIAKKVPSVLTVYGRIPVMTTERCILRALNGDKCVCGNGAGGRAGSHPDGKNTVAHKITELTDRMGAKFPVFGIDGCRNVIYNSVPLYMADRAECIREAFFAAEHYMFSVETAEEVDFIINAYRNGLSPEEAKMTKIRRIK